MLHFTVFSVKEKRQLVRPQPAEPLAIRNSIQTYIFFSRISSTRTFPRFVAHHIHGHSSGLLHASTAYECNCCEIPTHIFVRLKNYTFARIKMSSSLKIFVTIRVSKILSLLLNLTLALKREFREIQLS